MRPPGWMQEALSWLFVVDAAAADSLGVCNGDVPVGWKREQRWRLFGFAFGKSWTRQRGGIKY
jgi:hypothetical protein